MRLLAGGLLVAALLMLPAASATTTTSLGLSGPSAVVDLTTTANTTVPVTVQVKIDQSFVCLQAGSVKVTLESNATGPINASLDATSLTFTIPATADSQGSAFQANRDVNLSIVRTGEGNGTINVVANLKASDIQGCSASPSPPDDLQGSFKGSSKSINITTQALPGSVPATPTPTTSTPTPTTTVTPTASTPVSTSPVTTTDSMTPSTPAEEGKKGLPGPEVPLIAAAVVGLAVLVRRK